MITNLKEVVKKVGDEYCIFSKSDEQLECFPTEEEANKRLGEIEAAKAAKAKEARKIEKGEDGKYWIVAEDGTRTGPFETEEEAKAAFAAMMADAGMNEQKMTSADPRDGHTHTILELDDSGDGKTATSTGDQSEPHAHDIRNFEVVPMPAADASYISEHPGKVEPEAATEAQHTDGECPAGQKRNADGKCVPIENAGEAEHGNGECPPGQKRNADGKCVPVEAAKEGRAMPARRMLFLREESVADRPKGSVWDVVLISVGISANDDDQFGLPRHYGEAALRKAVEDKIFEGKPAMIFEYDMPDGKFASHTPDGISIADFPRQKVGWYESLRFADFIDHSGNRGQGIVGRMNLVDEDLRQPLVEAWELGNKDFLELSINAGGRVRRAVVDGIDVADVEEITVGDSVELVSEGARGGKFLRLVASKSYFSGGKMNKAIAIKTINKLDHSLLEGKNLKKLTDEDLGRMLQTVLDESNDGGGKKGDDVIVKEDIDKLVQKKVNQHLKITLWPSEVDRMLSESKLPDDQVKHLREAYKTRVDDRTGLLADIKRTKELLGRSSTRDGITDFTVTITEDKRDKVEKGLRGMFRESRKGGMVDKIPPFRSIYSAFSEATGNYRRGRAVARKILEGFAQAGAYFSDIERTPEDTKRLKEALSTASWPQVLGNALEKERLEASRAEDVNKWRKITSNISSTENIFLKRRIRIGGYGTVPIVAEGVDFPAVSSPGDQEVQITMNKRGYTEEITLEMILQDDINQLADIPNRMVRAGMLTLQQDIFNILVNNEALTFDDDTTSIFTTAHNNISTTALSRAQVIAGTESMMNQLVFGSAIDRFGEMNMPDVLLVDIGQWDQATEIAKAPFTFGTANEFQLPSSISGLLKEVVLISHTTDTNDWFLVNSKGQTIEIVFLDGMEEPEIFVQDMPNVGATFNADKVLWKLRHWWGRAPIDFRTFFGGVVA